MRVALIGCGRWGRHILRDLVALGCDVPVVARSAESRQRAREGGASVIVASSRELPDVDGIVIASATLDHAPSIAAVADRRVPIFVEKPLAISADEARRAADAAPGRVFVMHKWRYHPGIECLRDIARGGELGPLQSLTLTRVQWGLGSHRDTDIVWVLMPHDLSIVLEIVGAIPEPRHAVAERLGDRCLSLTGLLGGDPWVQIAVSERAHARCREVRMACRDGVAVLAHAYEDAIAIYRPGADPEQPVEERRAISTELPLLRQLRAFVEHLRGGPPPHSSADEEIAGIAAIERLRELAGAAPPARG